MTLADGTIITRADQSCWVPPTLPPIAKDSTKYANGTCNVCVSQSLPGLTFTTIGTVADYSVTIRDDTNHDMSVVNVTLAAFGGETGGKKTHVTIPIAGKSFHLWTMRTPKSPTWAAVYLDYGGPGPADPFMVPPMIFDPTVGGVGQQSCDLAGISPNNKRAYFQCGFPC